MPGAYKQFLRQIGDRGIIEFNYRYADSVKAHVFVVLKLADGADELETRVATLGAQGYEVVDMRGNEMAKDHVRFMVGGRCPGLPNERLFRFEFPERDRKSTRLNSSH